MVEIYKMMTTFMQHPPAGLTSSVLKLKRFYMGMGRLSSRVCQQITRTTQQAPPKLTCAQCSCVGTRKSLLLQYQHSRQQAQPHKQGRVPASGTDFSPAHADTLNSMAMMISMTEMPCQCRSGGMGPCRRRWFESLPALKAPQGNCYLFRRCSGPPCCGG